MNKVETGALRLGIRLYIADINILANTVPNGFHKVVHIAAHLNRGIGRLYKYWG